MILDSLVTANATSLFSLKAQELKKEGRRIISLGLREPDFETPPHIRKAAIDALNDGLTRYSVPQGLPELRELLAEKLSMDNGIDACADEITVTPGARNALYLACAAVLRPGDEVINLTPCYEGNPSIIRIAEPQATLHNVPLKGVDFAIDKQRIEALVNPKTKLVVINYPNNPTGRMLVDDEIEFIVKIVRDNKLYLLSDEIYEKITLTEKKHTSPAAFKDIQEKVITVNGFSKAYAMTGWRIGYVHANKELTAVMLKLNLQLNANTAAFIQKAAIAALTGSHTHLYEFIDNLKDRKEFYERLISENAHLTGSHPEAGFFAFLDISSTGFRSDAFCAQLLEETGVAILPGIANGSDFDAFCRVSLANATEIISEGLEKLGEYVNKWVRHEREYPGFDD